MNAIKFKLKKNAQRDANTVCWL